MQVLPAPAATRAGAREPVALRELLATLDRLSASLDERLGALARALPAAAPFAESARKDLLRHGRERAALAAARGVVPADPAAAADVVSPRSLPLLKAAFEELMHAHAEGLPVGLRDAELVHRLAEQMVDLSRLATVVDLWIEKEGGGE